MRIHVFASLALCSTLAIACGKTTEPPRPAATAESATPPGATAASTVVGRTSTTSVAGAKAEVGKPAPDFTLTDTDGKQVRLADFKGKTVVLEWFNPDCPYVKKSHEKGSLKTIPHEKTKQGVVWLAINSGAPGKQGTGAARNNERKKEWALPYQVLLDEKGEIGKAYGATNTPHMFVIDPAGNVVYGGAIDNSPDGEGESPSGGKLVNYVDEALKASAAGKPASVASTKAYGCSVKY